MGDQDEKYLTPGQVAKLLMVSPAAVRVWAEKGEISALTTPGGHRRFLQSEVNRFSEKRGLAHQKTIPEKLSVLIVDDDALFANHMKDLLSKHIDVANIEIACDGFDAGIKVRDLKPDIVLLDLTVPYMDGFEICRRLKSSSATSRIRVIVITANPSESNIKRSLAAGAEACLSKLTWQDELPRLLGRNKRLIQSGCKYNSEVSL